jgi:TPR repeat protein
LLRRAGQAIEASNPNSAARLYQRAAERGDGFSMAAMGQTALAQGDAKSAAQWLARADNADPNHGEPALGPMMSRLAASFSGAGQRDSAYDWYRRAANRGDDTAKSWLRTQERLSHSGGTGQETSGSKPKLFDKDTH